MNKPKTQQKANLNGVDGRDMFQTPNYATELLVDVLRDVIPIAPYKRFRIWECAMGQGKILNCLDSMDFDVRGTDLVGSAFTMNFLAETTPFQFDCIVTNPPFSLKRKFYEKCREYEVPFALLIPADYSGWIIKAVQDGAEKIIPTRRIDYITPTNKKSSSQFHSMWLTWGMNIGRTETFVELTNEMKKNI